MRLVTSLLLGLWGASLVAAPPKLTIPADLKPVSGYVRFTPDTDAKSVIYIPRDEAYPFPSDELKDPRRFFLQVAGLKDGPYRFYAVGSLNDEMTVVEFSVVIGKTTTPPPVKPPPGGGDPPPVLPVTKGYFLTVRPDGPASPEFTRAFGLPEWDVLRNEGHLVKEMTLTESQAIYKPPAGTTLPFTVTLSQERPTSRVLAGPVPTPANGDGVLKLREGVK